MINFKESKNIYLYSENIDMRFGLNKAQIIVASSFSKIEIRHSVFVFCSRDCRMIKIYYEDDYGAWLLQNKMFEKKYKWPSGLEIGQKISKQQLEGLCKGLEVIESKIIKENKQNKKCPECNKKDNKIYYPITNEVFNGSILTPSLASFIMYHKYELGIPFHHLSQHLTLSLGFEITKQNLTNYMAKSCEVLEPIYNQMKYDLLNNNEHVMHSDETTLVVTKKDEENKDRKKSYVYVYTSSFYSGNQIRIYDFQENRKIDQTAKWLSSFNGVIHCDDYSGYDTLKKNNPNIKLQRCWAHVRRRYADIVKALDSKSKNNSIAYKILLEISKLFELEKKYKKQNKNPIQILKLRQKDMPVIIKNIENLVFNCNPLKDSALDNAINYTKDCWQDLFTFMEDGYVELTNNACERAVKPFVVQRKVFQTSGSYVGARYTSKLFSIIQTCRINNINVEKYLDYVLNNINKLNVTDLTPYSKHISEVIK